MRIIAQLVDGASDEHVWGETYDRDLTDIFAIQTDVALNIANALRAELQTTSGRESAGDRPTTSKLTSCTCVAATRAISSPRKAIAVALSTSTPQLPEIRTSPSLGRALRKLTQRCVSMAA